VLGLIFGIGFPIALLAIVAIAHYNQFQTLENRCDEAWSNVDTELRRRHDLIPNLVATVKGYAKHEQGIQEAVAEARKLAKQTRLRAKDAEPVERRLGAVMGRLLAVAEDYPDLKASKNFLKLQEELAQTENRIQAARRFYNGNVRDQRNATRQFPGILYAKLFKPTPQDFFEVDSAIQLAPHL
jgi:LemA protein